MSAAVVAPVLQEETSDVTEALFSFHFDGVLLAYHLGSLAVAFLLALPVALDREHAVRAAGLRTFPLVALGSCAYMLIAGALDAGGASQGRALQGLMTGIGFVGGGAILKSTRRVTGTATAASIWTMGALGAAVALRRLEVALLLSAVTFATLRFLKPFKVEEPEEPEDDDERSK